jgi:hypothetical protein
MEQNDRGAAALVLTRQSSRHNLTDYLRANVSSRIIQASVNRFAHRSQVRPFGNVTVCRRFDTSHTYRNYVDLRLDKSMQVREGRRSTRLVEYVILKKTKVKTRLCDNKQQAV